MSAPRPGDLVGHYRLDEVIGLGGMGVVHAATDTRLGRRVALKIVLGHHTTSAEFTTRFQREAAVLARLDSPHVVAIFDHGEHEGQPYIAMQYAAGGDLGAFLKRRGAMPPALAARVASQVADALVAAHAVGVVHRDVKPANVLLRDERTDRLHVYLSDFGVALTESTGLTSPGAIAGTWNYLAPERARGEVGSPASDVYAVGCLFHELLTGRTPYTGSDVEVAMQHVGSPVPQLPGDDGTTRGVNRVLARSMAKDAAARYPSAAALRDDLRELAGTLSGATPLPGGPPLVGPRPPSPPSHPSSPSHPSHPSLPQTLPAPSPSPPRRRRRGVVVGAVLAVVAVVGVATTIAVVAGAGDDPGPGTTGPSTSTTSSGSPSTPVTSAPPAAVDAVANDLDGDGRFDAIWSSYDRTYIARSTASGWAAVERRPIAGRNIVAGDVTGDGRADIVEFSSEPPTVVVTVHDAGTTALPPTPVSTPRSIEDIDTDYVLADVDGDDVDDIVIATAPNLRTTELTVLISRGDGTFDEPRRWFRGRLDPRQAGWAVGDLDGDGADDLMHHATLDQGYTVRQGRVLLSSGTSDGTFTLAGKPLDVPEEIDGIYFSLERLDLGDVDGDGRLEVVGLAPYQPDAVVWEYTDGRFDSGRFWTDQENDYDRPDYGKGSYVTLGDVNGDGLADMITLSADDGLRAYRSSGTSFELAPGWRAKLKPDVTVFVDRVSLGIY
ncbi:protein kinase [Nocardioides sp. C4-1]|uniref:protein kinase domain-containing protein n=1 Tax=Nocardioides sp. C4-1 TaxID=3151851 RepID=UPI0032657CD7